MRLLRQAMGDCGQIDVTFVESNDTRFCDPVVRPMSKRILIVDELNVHNRVCHHLPTAISI